MGRILDIAAVIWSSFVVGSFSHVNAVQKHCGISNSNPFPDRIVGGVEADPHEFPWLTKIYSNNHFQCGGSLITDRHVISAGHCVSVYRDGAPLDPIAIRGNVKNYDLSNYEDFSCEFGAQYLMDKPADVVRRDVRKIILHPDYDVFAAREIMVQTNDVSILKVDPVEFSLNILPICLPSKDSEMADGAKFVVAGWGSTNTETIDDQMTKLPKSAMKTVIMKIPYDTCQKNRFVGWLLNNSYGLTSKTIFCGLGNNTDSCRGDSGGAAMLKTQEGYVLAGIVSWGIGCNLPLYPAAYTRLSSYTDFIEENTRDGKFLPHLGL